MSAWSRLRRIVNIAQRRGNRDLQTREVPASLLDLARSGPSPLIPTLGDPQKLRIATVIPSFRRGSGGHATIVNLMRELRERGHSVSLWLEDYEGRHDRESDALTKSSFGEFFDADGLDLQTDFSGWDGADVVMATGWQTVPRVLLLSGARARAYLVQDHEPDFYGASAQALFAAETYRQGLHCIAASRWLADVLRTRYGASTSHFDLAVDHSIYRQLGDHRREDLVVFYARAVTPRRAVPLGLLALEELSSRRPALEIALFGDGRPVHAPFAHTNLGVLGASNLAALYSRAAVGMVFSLTNPSLIGLEMMACGLACIELATPAVVATFGDDGPLQLVEPDPLQVCSAVECLLDDTHRREVIARRGASFMEGRTWATAAEQVEHGLRDALAASG